MKKCVQNFFRPDPTYLSIFRGPSVINTIRINFIEKSIVLRLRNLNDSKTLMQCWHIGHLAGVGRWPFGRLATAKMAKNVLAAAKCQPDTNTYIVSYLAI
jgi:hypothetical protein